MGEEYGYKEIDANMGRQYFPKVWTLVPVSLEDEEFFVNSFQGSDFRDCAEFHMGSGDNQPDEVILFVDNEDLIRLLEESTELYLFGAFNRVIVHQIRARCTVKPEDDSAEIGQIRKRLRTAIELKEENKENTYLYRESIDRRYATLDDGRPFRFTILSYELNTYERG